jgi:mono/diheme cytochrome c family protein
MRLPLRAAIGLLAGAGLALPVLAETVVDFLAEFEQQARQADPTFKGFSAPHGRQFFQQPHGNEWSCASCHTGDPADNGKHARTGKRIAPLAPAANPERFTSAAKVDKWFRRNCNDVLGRACTAQEKGDVLTWLATVKR